MIATLQGEITQIDENAVVIEIMGLGLRVNIPASLSARVKLGETILLYTHLVVREDAWNLYGFETKADRDLFLLLLGADGVGPRTAMALISGTTIDVIQRAVFEDSPELLGRVPGVGRKTAQKIILYLHDRLKPSDVLQSISTQSEADNEVLAALTALGYSVIEAQTAIQSIPRDVSQDVGERLKLALQHFSS